MSEPAQTISIWTLLLALLALAVVLGWVWEHWGLSLKANFFAAGILCGLPGYALGLSIPLALGIFFVFCGLVCTE